jgi:hypothetical protein
MRGRIVLFVILAIVTALVGVYLGWSTTTPKAVGEPATATPADSPVGPTQRRSSGAHADALLAEGHTAQGHTAQGHTPEGLLAAGSCPTGRLHHSVGPGAPDGARVAAAAQHRPGALGQGDDHAVGQHRRH